MMFFHFLAVLLTAVHGFQSELCVKNPFRLGRPLASSPQESLIAGKEVIEAEFRESITTLKLDLLRLAAMTGRGEGASDNEKDEARRLIDQLEAQTPTVDLSDSGKDSAEGTWELLFSDTQLFRSSPFFMAGRATCQTKAEAQQYDLFCDMHREALAISRIQRVRQIVSSERLVSEFEVSVGAVPFLESVPGISGYGGGIPLTITGSIVSSADIVSKEGTDWTLLMDTVEIKGSNVPLLRQILDRGLRLESRALGGALERNVPTYSNPTPVFRTTFLDDQLRISRDQDGKVFVYSKISDSTVPTDYDGVSADLGVSKLLAKLSEGLLG